MPKKQKTLSNGAENLAENDSVFDFLYQDVARIGSYLAQLTPAGHVVGLKQTRAEERAEQVVGKASVTGNVAIAKATADLTGQTGTIDRSQLERQIDPLWANAIELLNLLETNGLINRDISTARIGKFFLASGTLAIIDPSQLKVVWDVPELRKMLEDGVASGISETTFHPEVSRSLTRNQNMGHKQKQTSIAKTLIKTFLSLPTLIHARMADSAGNLFSAGLKEDGLSGSTTELFLANGLIIPGTWNILGVIDSFPGGFLSDDDATAVKLEIQGSLLTGLLHATQSIIRQAGRPENAYGMTPLLIFREAG